MEVRKEIGISLFRIKRTIFFLAAAICFILTGPGAATLAHDQAEVKALYLYNFLLFVDWPEGAADERKILRVAVTGDDPLFEFLRRMRGKPLKGRKLVIERFDAVEDLRTPCHALFISPSKRSIAPRILEKVREQLVLTMSDMKGFTNMGGMVYFKHMGHLKDPAGRLKRFEINLTAVEHAGLKIRSRLLRLSDIVRNP